MDYSARRKAQAAKTEEAILQAAMELCRGRRFEQVSVRDICQKAGITTGAFYHHFRSKEELLLRGFAPLDRYMKHALEEAEGTEDPSQRLLVLLRSYARFMEEQGWELLLRYYQRRLGEANPGRSIDPTRYTHRAMLGCLEELWEKGISIPGHTPEWTADFLFRHFRGVVIDWIIRQGSYPLWPKLEGDYLLFRSFFQSTGCTSSPETAY